MACSYCRKTYYNRTTSRKHSDINYGINQNPKKEEKKKLFDSCYNSTIIHQQKHHLSTTLIWSMKEQQQAKVLDTVNITI